MSNTSMPQIAAFFVVAVTRTNVKKHQFIRLLTAAFKDLHIKNSKKIIKRWYRPHHIDCVSMCCWI